MQTSSGVAASLASQVQATVPWTITALLRLDEATLMTEFNLTRQELRTAQNRARRAGHLWDLIMGSPPQTTPEALLAVPAHQVLLAQTGLEQADIERIFLFRDLQRNMKQAYHVRQIEINALSRQELWELSTAGERRRAGVASLIHLTGERRMNLIAAVARRQVASQLESSAQATQLGIPAGSLKAYLRGNWREDRMAWIRVAVSRQPTADSAVGSIGERIESAATQDGGLKLGQARIAQLAGEYMTENPQASDEDVCRAVAHKHNPGRGEQYVHAVLQHFKSSS